MSVLTRINVKNFSDISETDIYFVSSEANSRFDGGTSAMMNVGDVFSSVDDVLRLCEERGKTIQIDGPIKESVKEDSFSFSPAHSCHAWIDIPKDAVEDITFLGMWPCRIPGETPHEHPLVRLSLKSSGSPIEEIFKASVISNGTGAAMFSESRQLPERQTFRLASTASLREKFSSWTKPTLNCTSNYHECMSRCPIYCENVPFPGKALCLSNCHDMCRNWHCD